MHRRQQPAENALLREANAGHRVVLDGLPGLQEVAALGHRRRDLQMQSLRHGGAWQLQRARQVHFPLHSAGAAIAERGRRRSQRESPAVDQERPPAGVRSSDRATVRMDEGSHA